MATRCWARAAPAARLPGNCYVRAQGAAQHKSSDSAHRRAHRRAAACLRRKAVSGVRAQCGCTHAPATNASSHAVPLAPASPRVRLGSSSSFASASSAAVGAPAPHFTSRSVMSDTSTFIFAWVAQRAIKSDTVWSAALTSAYRAPAVSMRFTHAVANASRGGSEAPSDVCGSVHEA